MEVELKQSIIAGTIKKYSFKFDTTRWSNNQYCPDKTAAAEAEQKFLSDSAGSKFIVLNNIVRPTRRGYFADISYIDGNGTERQMVVFLSFWMCEIKYKTETEYFGRTDSLQAFLNYYGVTPPKRSDESGIALAANIQAIETRIPDPDGQFKSGGPRRAAIFYFNKKLEDAIVKAANANELVELGIDELSFMDSTHDTFHQGAGTMLPDLKNEYNVSYEVKGPFTSIPKTIASENLNKAADNILRFDGKNLVLYSRQADNTYEQINQIPFNFVYEEIVNKFATSWEDYWETAEASEAF